MATKASAKKKKQPTAKKSGPLPQYLPCPGSQPGKQAAPADEITSPCHHSGGLSRSGTDCGAARGDSLWGTVCGGGPGQQVVGHARTFCRGAQLAAGEQMSSGETPEQAAEYLLTSQGFSDAQAAVQEQPAVEEELPVTEIVDVTLDSDGWITDFSCIVANGKDSYLVTLDLTSGDATAEKQPRVEEN